MQRAEYDAIDAVNWTTLREMRRSPLHYKYRLTHPLGDTPRLALGRAVHTAVLEPMKFLREYALWTGGDRRGKAWTEFKAAHADKTILKEDEYDLCESIAAAVQRCPDAVEVLQGAQFEQTLTWTDAATGLACKGRVDILSLACLADLKTCRTIDARRFANAAWEMGQTHQAAFYRRGLRAREMHDRPARIIAVEAEAPHDCAVFDADPSALATADEEIDELLRRVAECRASGKWPGRYEAPQVLTLPAWMYDAAEDDAAALGIDIGDAA